jgi:hypothetical protein
MAIGDNTALDPSRTSDQRWRDGSLGSGTPILAASHLSYPIPLTSGEMSVAESDASMIRNPRR